MLSNIIKYILLFIIGLLVQRTLLSWLKKQRAYHPIYELSPTTHQKKRKTPSFGGVGIIITLFLSGLFFSYSTESLWCLYTTLASALIGFLDDTLATVYGKNKGLSAKYKFLLQNLLAILSLSVLQFFIILPLPIPVIILAYFLLIATPNATNLTDGLDGLLSGLGILSLIGFSYFIAKHNLTELAMLPISMIIAIGAFLVFNKSPAKLFMGDTGSLAIGTFLATLAIVLKNPLILIPLGAIYILETLSVIIQVISFKFTKKRIFLMAPLHHHFELLGLSETQVVGLFWTMGAFFLFLFIVLT
ncbi:MAG: phospho-N-acetylmuramoyl-pentapeptide-transferase [Candidatus Margulisbacteria bacterium]|nr:phospho-N-acetylmuramoyl-pentapeptide-transferase [Candidatus Margulisiibacteriota bacterium]